MMVSEAELQEFRRSGVFDEQWYLNEYPDVRDTGMDPATHYLWIGRLLGRNPAPVACSEAETPPDLVDPHVYEKVAEGFDAAFYLATYADIAEAGVDPLWHYLAWGWTEGRDPSIGFSTRHYLETNGDVRDAGINPFYHFLVAGQAEGRAPRHDLGFRYDILARLKPVVDQIAEAKAHRTPIEPLPFKVLAAALEEVKSQAVLSFSHDDFVRHVGGVQLVLRREQALLKARGFVQINLHPVYPLLFLDTSGDEVLLGVTVGGRSLGAFRHADVVLALREIADVFSTQFIVHNLLGHNIDQVIELIEAAGLREGLFWIHDYAPLYNNYKLMRNDVEFSGVPHPGTLAWELCEFARADFCHRDEFAKLFDRFTIDLLSPSRAALAIWDETGVLKPRSARVIEHCALRETASTGPSAAAPLIDDAIEPPLKVGFLGHPADHKGWAVFRELVLKFADDSRYEFYHLGSGGAQGLPVISREVIGDETHPDKMRDAVEDAGLDVTLVWSLWPETFCLIAYEAMAGGTAIITNTAAGNVCDLVRRLGEGLVLDSERDLDALFETGDIRHLARTRRTVRRFAIEYSTLTADCLEQQL